MCGVRLRFLTVRNTDGLKSVPSLQYWNGEYWEDVESVDCRDYDEYNANHTLDW